MTVTPVRAGRLLFSPAARVVDLALPRLADARGHDRRVVPAPRQRILQLTNLSIHDHQIAWTVHTIGAILMLAALVWAR